MQRDGGGRGEDLSRVPAANGVRYDVGRWVKGVLSDGKNTQLALVGVARDLGSEGAEVAEEHDKRRNVNHVWRRRREIF